MSDTQNGTGATSIVDRAETLLGHIGTRLSEARTRVTEKVTETVSPPAEAPPTSAPALPPVMDRAEETMDRLGERLGVFVSTVSRQLRKATALAREEAEDIWAEAQSLRGKETP